MTRKQNDQCREMRLWYGLIVVPTLMFVATIVTVPEVREQAADACRWIKRKIIRK